MEGIFIMKKKLLSLVLAGAMVASTSVSAFADEITIDGNGKEHKIEMTGRVEDQNGNIPSGTITVTVPTSVSFTIDQNGDINAGTIEIVNRNSEKEKVKVIVKEFNDLNPTNGIVLVKEGVVDSKDNTDSLVHAALKTYSKPLIQAGGKPVLNGLDIPIVADSKSCTFVIGQIISNAIKYRKDNLQIEFSTKTDKNNISLFISDNGIGISAADLPRVFDKGFTGENGRRYSKSTGIGLYLSQKLCKKMNIVLSVSSDPGQGTTVTMVFPTESYLKEAGL